MEEYTKKLKSRHKTGYVHKNRWPPISIKKFTKLGYIIHKSKRTAQEAKRTAELKRFGNFPSGTVEEISNILPTTNNECPQIILIEGAPGIGKTMLMREIRYLWATEKILKDKKAVFLLFLCQINEIKSTEDMFLHLCGSKQQAELCDTYFGNNDGQGLVLLLDGLDEHPQAMESGSFLYRTLIEERVFVNACIVITSRPHATNDVSEHVSYRVGIIGFTYKRRQEFVQENLKQSAEENLKNYLEKHEIIDTLCYIPLNMTIVLYLFNEKVRFEDLPKTQTELIKRAVEMTVYRSLELTQSSNLENLPRPYSDIAYYLSALAYNAIGKRLTFTSDEIRKACPVPVNGDKMIERAVINGLGLIQTAQFYEDGGDAESLSNFAHYSVQDLLAARYIAFSFSHRSYFRQLPLGCSIQNYVQGCLQYYFQLRTLKANFWNREHMNVWSFYIGLTGGKDMAFQHFLFKTVFRSYVQCKNLYRPEKFLKWLRLYTLQESTSYEILEHMDVVQCVVSKNPNLTKIKTLVLYFLLQEAPDNEMITELDAVKSIVTKSRLNLSEESIVSNQDLNSLGHILSRHYLTKQWELVNLSYCEIDDEKFEVLHEILTKDDGRPKPEIKDLQLSGNKLKSCGDAIANIVCRQKVSQLNLSNNMLKDIIPFAKCGDFLETLDVSNNKLGNEKVSQSLTALKFLRKSKVLKLNHNNIKDDEDVNDAIGLALCSCNSLEVLKLDGNIGEFESKATLLFTVINEVRSSKSDEHCYNEESDKASAFLKILDHCDHMDYQPESCALRNKLIQSKIVDISYNGLETNAGCCLGQRLHLLRHLKRLNIAKNKISDEATKNLTKGILLARNLVEFKYEENWFSKKSCVIFEMLHKLRTAIHKSFKCKPSEIEALLFILNCINDNVEELQSSDIVSTISLISELSLSHNEPTPLDYKLTSEDLQELCAVLTWFKQLEVLDVRNNDITNKAKQSLTKVMLQIDGLNCVKLFGNPIFDDQMSMAVFDTIKNIHEKQPQSIIDNLEECSPHIQAHSVIYVMECLSKLKNPYCFKSFNNIVTLDVDLESDYAGKFFEYLNFLPFLKNLKINNVACITDCGINQLSGYLSRNIMLTTLDLSHCNLENLETKNGAGINNSLKLLKCNYCKITNESLRNLMLMFRNVDHLEIEGNHLGDKGISTLLLSYENSQQKSNQLVNLKIFNIANNNISDKSIRILTIEILLTTKLEEFKYIENLFSENSIMTFEMVHKLRTAVHESFKCKPSEIHTLLFILKCINDSMEELQSSDIVSIIRDIKELNLSHDESTTQDYKLTSENLKELCAVLTWFKQLEVLDIRNNDITEEAAKKPMIKAVLQMNTLKELRLSGNPIFDNMSVFDTIVKLRKGQVESISCNQNSSFHEEGYCVIYIMECSLENMNHLNLFDNITTLDIDSDSELAGKIFECLNYLPFLREIIINHVSCITEYGMNQFSKYLSHESTLTTLDLSFCNLKNLTIKKATKVSDSLKILKCNNSNITDKLLRDFMLMFGNVDHLEVEGNQLGDEGIGTLHSVLLNQTPNTSMTTLKLANNQITSRSAIKIIEIMQKHKVKHLDISHNRLTTFRCSKNHTITTLEELHISGNGLEVDESFTRILQNCTQLVILDLENNNITNTTFKHLATGYLFTSTLVLENLRLNGNSCMDYPKNREVLKMVEKRHLKSDYEYFDCHPAKFNVFLTILELVDSANKISNNIPKIISCIKNLNLSYTEPSDSHQISLKLRSSDLKNLCKYLSYFKSLEYIYMIDNNIEDKDAIDNLAIAVLKNRSVFKVLLEGNPIHKLKECFILFDTIEKMRTCESSDTCIDRPETLEGLIKILKYINTFDNKTCDITEKFERLDISCHYQSPDHNLQNKSVDIEGMCTDLVNHIKLFSRLQTLNLNHAYLSSDVLQELSRFLHDNNTLLQLDLSYNSIQAEGALVILGSLDTNTTLKELNLSNNKITGEKKCREIALIVHRLRKKIKIDVKDNKLTEESKRMLGLK